MFWSCSAHTLASPGKLIDPKLVADQLGRGPGVNLDVYTIFDLTQRLESVNVLEQSLVSPPINWIQFPRGRFYGKVPRWTGQQ